MRDIVEQVDQLHQLLEQAGGMPAGHPDSVNIARQALGIGIDMIGEAVANGRRIAVALESIANMGNASSYGTLEDMMFHAGQAFARGQRVG